MAFEAARECAVSHARVPTHGMTNNTDRFVRFPMELMEVLLWARLSGTQWRIVLWVIRWTRGWNRLWTPFTWYRIAKELRIDRPTVYRAGTALVRANIVVQQKGHLAIQLDYCAWSATVVAPLGDDSGQLWMPGMRVARQQRRPLSRTIQDVAKQRENSWQDTTVSRRAKDSRKEGLETYKDNDSDPADEPRHPLRRKPQGAGDGEYLSSGAARPIPGKYDSVSEN
jgi:phage replication O-like protein O